MKPPDRAHSAGGDPWAPAPSRYGVWRVAGWTTAPSSRPDRRPTFEIAVAGVLLAWNLAANLLLPDESSLLLGVFAASLLLLLARRADVSRDYLGLRKEFVGTGVKIGLACVAVVITALGVIAAIPATREVLADDRFRGVGSPEMLFETLARIPIGTALAEEVAFRGVVLGMLLLWTSPRRAVIWSSVLFGLWHVLPAIDALATSPAADIASGPLATFAEVGGQVVITGVVGAGFAWLRLASRSIVTPALAHFGLNAGAYAVGWLVVRNGWS